MEIEKNGWRKIGLWAEITQQIFLKAISKPLPPMKILEHSWTRWKRPWTKSMVDVRSPKEFTGEILAPPEYPKEYAQRGGHIPGAENIPWAQAIKEDGTFKPKKELEAMYNKKA
jgi:3-mercaptopyruvate sulfurtransferase SseA